MALIDGERNYLSYQRPDVLGLVIHVAGVPTDPDDPDAVTVSMVDPLDVEVFADRVTSHDAPGVFTVALTSADTATPGVYDLVWSYELNSSPETYRLPVEVGVSAPAYDDLSADAKAVVDSVWVRLADLFDSPSGGPNLQVYIQSNFGRGRIAQLLDVSVGQLNLVAQPRKSYTGATFPYDKWGGLLQLHLWVETVKHLRRSYLEQPDDVGVSVAHTDRRDYFDRWGQIIADEMPTLKKMMDHFAITHMFGGAGARVLVSGGIFAPISSYRTAVSGASPRLWARYY